jgi:hypothetical protein
VNAIAKVNTASSLLALGELIADTRVPKDHEAIYGALVAKATELDMVNEFAIHRAILSLREQGKEAKENRRPDSSEAL